VTAPHGPYWTRGQAAAAINGADGHADQAKRHAAIVTALNETGTKAGVFDLEILDWLAATWEPETVQVFIGLIRRARAARDAELQGEIDTLRAQIESLETAVRCAAPLAVDLDQIRTIAERRANP
jgi:hypothetical protein